MPDEAEVLGLLALMLLHDARRDARLDADGALVLLEDQDRSLWDGARIERGPARARSRAARCGARARTSCRPRSPRSTSSQRTDWAQIEALYCRLGELTPSPVVELNRAVAVAMATVPSGGSI